MKPILLSFLFIQSLCVLAQGTWSDTLKVDDGFGDIPNIYFKSNGDMFLTFKEDNGSDPSRLVYKRRDNGQSNFGNLTPIGNGGSEAYLLEYGGDTIYAVYQTSSACKVVRSDDDGLNWVTEKSYSNTEMFDGQGRAILTKKGNDVNLFYHFQKVSGIFGTQPFVKRASRTNWSWGTAQNVNFEELRGAYEKDGKIVVFTSKGIHRSSDNVSYVFDEGGASNDEKLNVSDISIEGEKISLVRQYSYGVSPSNHIRFTQSLDGGDTWYSTQVQIGSFDYSLSGLHVATAGNKILITWYAPTGWVTDKIVGVMSDDGGTSWGAIDTIVTLASDESLSGSDSYTITAHNDKFYLAYSPYNSTKSTYNTFLKEWSENVTSIKKVKKDNFILYPNPTNGELNFSLGRENALIKVFNLTGVLVKNVGHVSGNVSIDINNQPKGVYFLEKIQNGKREIFKVFKK